MTTVDNEVRVGVVVVVDMLHDQASGGTDN